MSELKLNSPFSKPVGPAFSTGNNDSKAVRDTTKRAYSVASACAGNLKNGCWEDQISWRISDEQNIPTQLNERLVPLAALASKRDLNIVNSSLTIENEVADFVIPALRANIALPGATILPQVSGSNLLIPRVINPGVAGSGETATIEVGTFTFEQVKLQANQYSTQVNISNQLLQQAKTDLHIEDLLKDVLIRNVAQLIDFLCINGTGQSNGQALGILNYQVQGAGAYDPANLAGSITFGGAPALSKVVSAHAALDTANYPESDRVWLLSPAARGVWEQTQMVSGYPRFLYDSCKVLDYPAIVTGQLASTNQAIFVRQSEAVIAMFGGFVSILSDPFTLAHVNQTLIRVSILADFVLTRGGAVISTDSAAQ